MKAWTAIGVVLGIAALGLMGCQPKDASKDKANSGGPAEPGPIEPGPIEPGPTEPAWGTAAEIDAVGEDFGSPDRPVLTVDASGNVTVMWTQGGNSLQNNWARRNVAGVWGAAQLIESDDVYDAGAVNAVVDGSGNVTAVWRHWDGERYNIWANRFDGTAWGAAGPIETVDLDGATFPVLAVDGLGNVTAVWTESDGTIDHLWANRFSNGAWGTAEQVDANTQDNSLSTPVLVADSSGKVTALWQGWDGTQDRIWANRFNGTAWGTAQILDPGNPFGTVYTPALAVDGSGNVTAAWRQEEGAFQRVLAARYSGAAWGVAVRIDTEETSGTGDPKLAVDASGNVTAAWSQIPGSGVGNIWASRFSGVSWDTAQKIAPVDLGGAYGPVLAVDGSGNVTAAWRQSLTPVGGGDDIWANRSSGGTWGTAVKIETEDLGYVEDPLIAVDSSGDVTAVWLQYDGTRINLWANRSSGGAWGTAVKIESGTDEVQSQSPTIAVAGSGEVTVAWLQNNGGFSSIWANRYSGGAWGTAVAIASGTGSASSPPALAVDGSGNVTVAWVQFNGTVKSMFASRFTSGSWTPATDIGLSALGDAGVPLIAVDAAGNVTVVWPQQDGTWWNMWANRFSGGAWGTAQLIETDDFGDAYQPNMVVDSAGRVVVVWIHWDGALYYNIMSNRFDGTAWETAQLLETEDLGSAFYPVLARDGAGNVAAVWYQNDGSGANIWANVHDGTSWGGATLIETDDAGGVEQPAVVGYGTGIFTAVWVQHDGTRNNMVANRFNGTAWGTPTLIEADDVGAAFPVQPLLVVDGTGNVTAVWRQTQSSGPKNLLANRFTGTSWGSAAVIDSEDLGDVLQQGPSLTVDGAGNVVAAWLQYDGTRYNIWANRFSGGAWGTAQKIESDDQYSPHSSYPPALAADGSGNVTVAWAHDDGTRYNIWANRFSGGAWGSAVKLDSEDLGYAIAPQLAADAAGNVTAVWPQFDGAVLSIWTNRFH